MCMWYRGVIGMCMWYRGVRMIGMCMWYTAVVREVASHRHEHTSRAHVHVVRGGMWYVVACGTRWHVVRGSMWYAVASAGAYIS